MATVEEHTYQSEFVYKIQFLSSKDLKIHVNVVNWFICVLLFEDISSINLNILGLVV